MGSLSETSLSSKKVIDRQQQPRKRNKPSLVCSNCKRRKIKCDRRLPCSSCVKMKCGYECSYEPKWQPISFDKNEQSYYSNLKSTDDERNSLESQKIGTGVSKVSVQPTNKPMGSEDPLAFENNSEVRPVEPSYVSKDMTHEINPVGSLDETINFFDGFAPFHVKEPFRRVSHGSLSWACFMKKDPWLLVIWTFAHVEKVEFPCLLFTGPTEVTKESIAVLNGDETLGNPDIVFKRRALEIDGYEELAPLSSLKRNTSTSTQHSTSNNPKREFKFENESKLGQSTVTIGQSLFQGKVNPELEVITQFKSIIPKKRVAWGLLDRFFNTLYSTMPFLDEEDFKEKISAIIGPRSFDDSPVEFIRVVNKLDLANLCTFVIVLRLSYLSLFDNKNAKNEAILKALDFPGVPMDLETEHMNYLMKHPINLSAIEVVLNTLRYFDGSRKTNLTVFQCFLFVRLYNMFAPEEGDGHDGGDSNVLTAKLVQMAMSLGLNRDPDNFPELFKNERVNNLGRKIWWFLVREDLTSCLSIGNLSSISSRQYDTLAPFYKDGNANVSKVDLELATIQVYKWFITRAEDIGRIVDMALDVRKKIRVEELTTAISLLEKQANNEDTFDGPYLGIKTDVMLKTYSSIRTKLFLYLKSSLISLIYHLFLYYEDKLNYELSFFYLKKLVSINLYYILPTAFDVLCGKHSGSALTLNPILQLAMHKANQINLAAGVRVGYLVYNLEQQQEHSIKFASDPNYRIHFGKLKDLFEGFVKCGRLYANTFAKLALKYYYAWRISKAHEVLFQILRTNKFYKGLPGKVRKMSSFQFNTPQLQELNKLVQHSSKWLEQIVDFEELQDTPKVQSDVTNTSSFAGSPPKTESINHLNEVKNDASSDTLDMNGGKHVSENFVVPGEDIDQMWLLMLAMKSKGDFQPGGFGSQTYPQYGHSNQEPLVANQVPDQQLLTTFQQQSHQETPYFLAKPGASQSNLSYNETHQLNRNNGLFENEISLDFLDNMLL